MACDLLLASSDAIFSIPAVKEGVVADVGPMRLARLVGVARAKYLCFLGRRFGPAEGLTMGLLSEVVAPNELEQRTLALAEELLAILMNEMTATQEDCLRSPEHAKVMVTYREV